MQKAKDWHCAGKSWHFHMLTPDCMLNEVPHKQAFVLENSTDQTAYVAYSEKRFMKEGEELLKILHGDNVMDTAEVTGTSTHTDMKRVLEKIQQLTLEGRPWHHHHLFPDCMFNVHKGKWCLLFEDKDAGETIELLYDEEPIADLREIEVLFYSQKE